MGQLTEDIIKGANLSEEDVYLMTTPFSQMSKADGVRAFMVSDRISAYNDTLNSKEKETIDLMSDEERIHLNKDKALYAKRNFY